MARPLHPRSLRATHLFGERSFDDRMEFHALNQGGGIPAHGTWKLGKVTFSLLGNPFVEGRDSYICQSQRGKNVPHVVAECAREDHYQRLI